MSNLLPRSPEEEIFGQLSLDDLTEEETREVDTDGKLADGTDGGKSAEADKDTFTLKHLGVERSVSRDELIALAQKGMDYDRIRLKLSDAYAKLNGEQSDDEIKEFMKRFPDVARSPDSIPPDVWMLRDSSPELSLSDHYSNYLIQQKNSEISDLKMRISQLEQSFINKNRSTGTLANEGSTPPPDMWDSAWLDAIR